MATNATTDKDNPVRKLICLDCLKSRFPSPQEQCYKFGGLICTVDDANVEKYQGCRFGYQESEFRRQ